MAVVVLVLVPDPTVQLGQPRRLPDQPRRRDHLLHHGAAVVGADLPALHSGASLDSPVDPAAQADLAGLLPQPGQVLTRRNKATGAGSTWGRGRQPSPANRPGPRHPRRLGSARLSW